MYDPNKAVHKMRLVETTDEYHAFECETPSCGRRVIYSLITRNVTVIIEGDPNASHPTLSIPKSKRPRAKKKDKDPTGTDNDPYLNVFKDFFNGH